MISAERESQVRTKHVHRRESSHLVVERINGGSGEEVILSWVYEQSRASRKAQDCSGNSQQCGLGVAEPLVREWRGWAGKVDCG